MAQYVYGNTVRKEEEYIHPIWEKRRKERRKIKVNAMTWILSISMIAVFASGFMYSIDLMADTAVMRENYFALQNDYKNLKDKNDNTEEEINNDVDMEEIRMLALEEFGMKLPGEGQVINYSSETADYVEQYADISGLR
ncbi:MAG: hypothetical protein K6E77_10255 [Lachnospiraceae bacterium]|nr:hypothetical protein [Lachnospiraceae bacterium]